MNITADIVFDKKSFRSYFDNHVGKDFEAHIGVPEGATNIDTGELVADYAMKNEYGTSRIPPRPFMRETISENSKEWADDIKKAMANGMTSKEALEIVGINASKDVQIKISSNMPPPNSPETIEKKLQDGRSSPTTLVDTGSLLQSISSVVVPVGTKEWK